MKNKLKALVLVVFGLAVASCGKKQEGAPAAPPAEISVTQVAVKDVTGYQLFPASIEGKINNAVRAKIQGYIQEVYVHEGQFVKKGQALFRLETNILTQNAAAAKSGIASAEANVNVAQVEVNKLVPLVEKGIISNIQLETAKANLASAKSMLAQAKANYNSVNANIDYSMVRSPIDGIVGSLPFKNGSLVGPTDQLPLTTVSDISEVFAFFSMNEKEYFNFLNTTPGNTLSEKIKNLPEVELILADGVTYGTKGKIETVTGQIDAATGTVQFRVAFKNADKLLSNGNSGTVKVPHYYKDVLVVPEAATFEQQGTVNVFRVEKDTTYAAKIEVIDRVDNMVVVKDGVKKGETIVGIGAASLRNKTAIKPKMVNFDTIVKPVKQIF